MAFDIVVISDEWSGHPFSCKHLLRNFLPSVPLFWVQAIGLRSPRLTSYDIARGLTKMRHWLSSATPRWGQLPQNLYLINPVQIPYNHNRLLRVLNQRLLEREISRKCPVREDRNRVLLTTWPFINNTVGRIGEHLSIYYRVDDFSEFPGVHGDFIRDCERDIINKVDMVIVTSENLLSSAEGAKCIKYLPHGVDPDHFSRRGKQIDEDLPIRAIPRPRIGFFGALDSWIDLDLIRGLAQARSDWSFVLVGPSQIEKDALPRSANLHYLGPIAYDKLPNYARHFDAAIIPFKLNKLTIAVNPLKLLEYLSMGLPVVSSPLPEVAKYGDHVSLASGIDEFEGAIERELRGDSDHARNARRHVAQAHSWERRARQLREWIDDALQKKGRL